MPAGAHEFVAADAGQGIAVAQRLAQARGGLAQDGVADRVAEAVVDLFKTVEADVGDRKALAGAARVGDHHADAVRQQQPVRQFGQRIVGRHVAQPLFGGALGRDVAAHGQQVVAAGKGRDAQLEPGLPVAAAQARLEQDRIVAHGGVDDRVAQRRLVGFGGQRRQGVAGQRRALGQQLAGAGAGKADQARRVEAEHDVARGFQQLIQAGRLGRRLAPMRRILFRCSG
jgi:hypothetical protein